MFIKIAGAAYRRAQATELARGAGMAEYVLLLALVAAAMVAAFGGLVTAMSGQVGNIAALVGN